MAVRKLRQSWQYDFKISGFERQCKGRFRKRSLACGKRCPRETPLGDQAIAFQRGPRPIHGGDSDEGPRLGCLRASLEADRAGARSPLCRGGRHVRARCLQAVTSEALGPKSINQHPILIRAALRFLWKRGRLRSVLYVPMESVPQSHADWYTKEERDQLLEGMFRLEPQWYLFYYLTTRLGLRAGEVYAIARRQVRREQPRLVVDQAVQRGTKTRPARLATRKNDDCLCARSDGGHIGRRRLARRRRLLRAGVFLLQDRRLPTPHRQSRPTFKTRATEARSSGAQPSQGRAALGSKPSDHGRRVHQSRSGTAWTSFGAEHAQVAHLGSGAQRHLVEALQPARAPHESSSCEAHVNRVSTDVDEATRET